MKLNLKALIVCGLLMAGTTGFAQTVPQQTVETQQVTVTDAELEKFVKSVQELEGAENEARAKMIAIVEGEDLEIEKFNEIHQAKMQNLEVQASQVDLIKHDKAVAKLEAMQPEIQEKMEAIITAKGLSMERFQQIANALQSSPALQQRFQKLIMG